MPLDDDLTLPTTDEELARRKALALLGTGALAVAGLGTAIVGFRFLEPSVVYEEDARVSVGKPDEIPPGTVLVIPKHGLYVIRSAAGFFALSSVCTHLGCMTRYLPEDAQIACPCHGSRFSLEGKVTAGPAPRPLRRLQITVERGVLVVDASKEVQASEILKVA
jgi:nitrite reductase/ring-hydroxylating ferredoxin subunit